MLKTNENFVYEDELILLDNWSINKNEATQSC